jgi:hypothetical protein
MGPPRRGVAWPSLERPGRGASAASVASPLPRHRTTSRALVRAQQAHELWLLENQPLSEAPRIAAPLVLEVNPSGPGTRVPKRFPDHREMVAIRTQPNDVLDTDPLRIAAPKPVRNAQRATLALAPTEQKALIPAAWCQLIPDEGCDAP